MQTSRTKILAAALAATMLAAPLRAQAPDVSFLKIVRGLVNDSLRTGGRAQGERFFAADAVSEALLRSTGLVQGPVVPAPAQTACPDPKSTAVPGAPVGYRVTITDSLTRALGQRLVGVTLRCEYLRDRKTVVPFAQWALWELRLGPQGWTIVRKLFSRVT